MKVLEPPVKEASTFIVYPPIETESNDLGTLTTHNSENKNDGSSGLLSAKYEQLMRSG